MQPIIIALWPVFALLLLGFLARRSGFPGEGFWQPAEKATYYVLFPALLVERLANAQLAGDDSIRLAALVVVVLVMAALFCCACKPLLRLTVPAFTSFFRAVYASIPMLRLLSLRRCTGQRASCWRR